MFRTLGALAGPLDVTGFRGLQLIASVAASVVATTRPILYRALVPAWVSDMLVLVFHFQMVNLSFVLPMLH
jgi:hypothetical protein